MKTSLLVYMLEISSFIYLQIYNAHSWFGNQFKFYMISFTQAITLNQILLFLIFKNNI